MFGAPPRLVIENPGMANRACLGAHEVYNLHPVMLTSPAIVERGFKRIQCGENGEEEPMRRAKCAHLSATPVINMSK